MPLPENPPQGRLPFPVPAQISPEFCAFWGLWRDEKFWACHEALEELWRAESCAARRRFLQGLVHLCAAVFQHRRGNAVGAARQMVRARVRLEPFFPRYENLEIEAMFRGVEREVFASLSQEHRGLAQLEAQLRARLDGETHG